MNSPNTEMKAMLFTSKPLDASQYAEKLYELLDSWTYRPYKFSDVEPFKFSWSNRDDFVKICKSNNRSYFGITMVKWAKPELHMSVVNEYGPKSKCHRLSVFGGKIRAFGGPSAPLLLELIDRLFEEFKFDYGFSCTEGEYTHSNMKIVDVPTGDSAGTTVKAERVIGMEWPDCIPGFYWCNYFGDIYFQQGFGTAIENLPSTKRLRNGVRVLRSISPLDWNTDGQADLSNQMMKLLGEDWFFTKQTGMPSKSLFTDKSLFAKPPKL